MQERIQVELRGLEYESRGRNTEDTKRGENNLNKEISVTRKVRVTTGRHKMQTDPSMGFELPQQTSQFRMNEDCVQPVSSGRVQRCVWLCLVTLNSPNLTA